MNISRLILIVLVIAFPLTAASKPEPAPPGEFWKWHENHQNYDSIDALMVGSEKICSYVDEDTDKLVVGFLSLVRIPNNTVNVCYIPYIQEESEFSYNFWLFQPPQNNDYKMALMPHDTKFPKTPQVITLPISNKNITPSDTLSSSQLDNRNSVLLCTAKDSASPQSELLGLKTIKESACHVGAKQYKEYSLLFVTVAPENKKFMVSSGAPSFPNTKPYKGTTALSLIEHLKFYTGVVGGYFFFAGIAAMVANKLLPPT